MIIVINKEHIPKSNKCHLIYKSFATTIKRGILTYLNSIILSALSDSKKKKIKKYLRINGRVLKAL